MWRRRRPQRRLPIGRKYIFSWRQQFFPDVLQKNCQKVYLPLRTAWSRRPRQNRTCATRRYTCAIRKSGLFLSHKSRPKQRELLEADIQEFMYIKVLCGLSLNYINSCLSECYNSRHGSGTTSRVLNALSGSTEAAKTGSHSTEGLFRHATSR